jgi:hypothetical protein
LFGKQGLVNSGWVRLPLLPLMKVIGICPICDREMWENQFVDRHHFLPKCRGGKETEWLHKICHRKIHSLFTEKELEKKYNNAELVKEHPEMEKFIKWVSKKEPDFYDSTTTHNRKRGR